MVGLTPIYDATLIGKLLAMAGDHWVYRYGADSVLKISKFDMLRSSTDLVRFYNDEIAYFENLLGRAYVKPVVMTNAARKKVALIQPFITGQPLSDIHLKNPAIRKQLLEITDIVTANYKRDRYIDLVGGGVNFFAAVFGNIFVSKDNQLLIIDCSVVKTKDFVFWIRPLVALVVYSGNKIQAKRIKKLCSFA